MIKMNIVLIVLLAVLPAAALAQNVTPDVIFGSGNANGSFTIDTSAVSADDTIELGLRGKVRFNASGAPENTFNELAPGEYYFFAGVGPTQSFPTPTWAFEWSVNTNATGNGQYNVGDLTYELGLDTDPGAGTIFGAFDPITPSVSAPWYDHSMGDNTTANGAGVEAVDSPTYLSNLASLNVAQNSWRYSWFVPGFDPNVVGIYDIYLKAFLGGAEVAHTQIQVHVSYGEPVANEDASWGNVKALFR